MSHPALRPIRALLLDVGGTILLADLDLVARVLAEGEIVVAREDLHTGLLEANRRYAQVVAQGAGHEAGWELLLRTWLERAGLTRDDTKRGSELLRTAHDRYCLWRTVADGAAEAIGHLRAAGVPVGAVSNSEGRLQQILDGAGLGSAFDTVLDSALEGVRKPDPEIFLRACRLLDVNPRDALYAGDIPEVDVQGALGAGLQAALIDPYDAHPDYTEAPRFPSVASLAKALVPA
ncbi:MAG: HAD-IA family hydrolase [Deltaproteobacteria bacterium]|jgi:putative hydrolase of the HAD superfamily|nr:HAD-IA family hydrolase [Deltaproteobacteria bacterium]MBW2536878.1 HAD-IA family hydrolase [Deltaproteobacteria bacterium]